MSIVQKLAKFNLTNYLSKIISKFKDFIQAKNLKYVIIIMNRRFFSY
jgi:hypothetical protein